jgi:hypothetical protein
MKDRRVHIRYDFNQEIRYVRGLRASGKASDKALRAITIDISTSGIAMYTFAPLRAGEKITITDGLEDTCQKCTVAWCKELGDNVFKTGLSFILNE